MQYRQINPLARPPQLLDQRLGIQLAVEGEEQRHGMSENDGRIRHHSLSGLQGEALLLFGAKRASTLADLLANLLSGERDIGLYSHAGLITSRRNDTGKCNTGRHRPKTTLRG
ncbi:Uncharacterised protein [Klebsiella pneumoniae subsp. ozaenae]|uniref:Uncharacterized protein n=1 Tax=Klebsiella pneumoniae subsp. ozaenae TaxID=574 RepID=A0A378AML3_KLEPO|nr:Uncharacterised protein [Klebsiella pneumoniae subsp. ozaenae]